MNEVSLTSFLKKCPSISKIVFPAEDQRFIEAEEVIRCISYEGDGYAANKVAGDFFIRYIREINQRHAGKVNREP